MNDFAYLCGRRRTMKKGLIIGIIAVAACCAVAFGVHHEMRRTAQMRTALAAFQAANQADSVFTTDSLALELVRYFEIEEGKKAMFRTGGLSSLFSGKGSGLTLGRMAYVQSLNNSTKYHEFYHMQDINRMGWANFYARTLHEYFKYGFPKVYEIKNTLEWNADQYMDYRNKNPL